MSTFWSWYVIVLTVLSVIGIWWLIRWTSKPIPKEEGGTTHHVWDEDLEEYNNPLPRWWLNMFYISIVFSIGYLLLYPGLGNFAGLLGWSSTGQYQREVDRAEAIYAEIFERFAAVPIPQLARDPEAMRAGHNLYMNNCAMCHGSDARGALSFPNLANNDWLWGGTPEALVHSIARGRNGVMPGWGAPLGEEGVAAVTEFTLKLAGRDHDAELAAAGESSYNMFCVACHGPDGRGNTALGAPNLTNDIWLHGGSRTRIAQIIREGVMNEMPAQGHLLGDDRVHVLAAYVYALNLED